jgi:acyl-coenzyme A synthetase/AMP-(fatty) acid ligase
VKDVVRSPLTLRRADDVIAWDGDKPVSLRQFLSTVIAIANDLPTHAFVFNLCKSPRNYLFGFYASMVAGQCTLMPPNRLRATLEEILEEYQDSYILSDCGLRDFDVAAAVTAHTVPADGHAPCPVIPDQQLCAIAFTSGSTGRPQPNHKFWRTLRCGSISNARMLFDDLPGPISVLSTVPPQHMWGLETTILMPLFGEVAISGCSPFYPLEICQALQDLPGPRVLVSTPVHLRALVDSGLSLPPVARILSATAQLSPKLAQELESRHDAKVLEVFGCSESGILASRSAAHDENWSLAEIFQLDIVGGRARIIAEHLPEAVYLQDVVESLPGNRFRWLGRHQDLVNIAGKRASLADINRRLLEVEGVIDGIVVFPDDRHERLAALVVAPGRMQQEVLGTLRKQIDPVFLPRPLFLVDRLPRTETGKLPRKAVLELFAARRAAKANEPCA